MIEYFVAVQVGYAVDETEVSVCSLEHGLVTQVAKLILKVSRDMPLRTVIITLGTLLQTWTRLTWEEMHIVVTPYQAAPLIQILQEDFHLAISEAPDTVAARNKRWELINHEIRMGHVKFMDRADRSRTDELCIYAALMAYEEQRKTRGEAECG